MSTQFQIDVLPPILARVNADKPEPSLTNARVDSEELVCAKSTIDIALPPRRKDLTDIALLIFT
jgi:hypothetical protein